MSHPYENANGVPDPNQPAEGTSPVPADPEHKPQGDEAPAHESEEASEPKSSEEGDE